MLAYTYISPGKFELIDKPKDFAKNLGQDIKQNAIGESARCLCVLLFHGIRLLYYCIID